MTTPIPSQESTSSSNERDWIKRASKNELMKMASDSQSSTIVLMNQKDFGVCGCVVKLDESLLFSVENDRIVAVDVGSRELLRVEDIVLRGLAHNQVIDLSDEGWRWDGDALNGDPYGWGVLYDKDNNRRYDGFRVGNVNMCYGRVYGADSSKIEFEGEWCDGKRWGHGVQYNQEGGVVYDGEWLNDEPFDGHVDKKVTLTPSIPFFHSSVEELVVGTRCCNDESWSILDFQKMPLLRTLKVEKNCFAHVNEVRLIGMSALESVLIGSKSFGSGKGCFMLKECPLVRELKMGAGVCPSPVASLKGTPSYNPFSLPLPRSRRLLSC